ncbi:hypothetical protein LZC95_44170 [Pendulispora brunnea]|uniref:Lipoprotein n=1 Tax=Pendulispora brunnea TaxID=2905690 RepID=A0ABZ2K8K9_9BACT
MPALIGRFALGLSALLVSTSLLACKKKVDADQCTQLIDRYATLVVRERFPDASAEQVQAEQTRERDEARGDENFRSCVSEVTEMEFKCAMSAQTTGALEKCLE